ncbi:sugar-binding domain-containing protein [Chitinophaga sp.]|uniref:sugar-binding domain-containing protein n=1 Tax=Chitinophaga sp. TaxID=1869181 RepID=UPI0031D3D2B0
MKKRIFILLGMLLVTFITTGTAQQKDTLFLAGEWRFLADPADKGITDRWFSGRLKDTIHLPGSMTTNGKGDDISLNTPWTGEIIDSSYFFMPQYAPYRVAGNIKVPFWLQPTKYYKGAAWYQKSVVVPASWANQHLELLIERSHWETTVWIDNKMVGMQNSLATAHRFDLTGYLTPGEHQITVRVDNRVKDINVGMNSHSITDHTQTNWNGMTGKLLLSARPPVFISDVQLYPDVQHKNVHVKVMIKNTTGVAVNTSIQLHAVSRNIPTVKEKTLTTAITIPADSLLFEATYSMGDNPMGWDEFHPNIYTLETRLKNGDMTRVDFGMRSFSVTDGVLMNNGHRVFLRGTLECAIFPLTGYPATDLASWLRIFETAKSYGLNHLRFHSWCPPEAAFQAADRLGFYLQIECSSWANSDTRIGDGAPIDQYIYEESNAIVKAYGNHPSFCMLTYGNEPAGKHYVEYLTAFVNYWKRKDGRRIYTAGSGWPSIAENDYHVTPDPRIQAWGSGLKSIINAQAPSTDYDWSGIIKKWKAPTVSHEIGQWCVYPDFKEIKKYTGVVRAKNFEIFQTTLRGNGLGHLADSFLLASGKLQVLCYKADIEAALRTPGFGGFQLLGLYDFPGQGTALVGVLNAFWQNKGYVTAKEFKQFCNTTVPLARLPKMIYLNSEQLSVPVEVAHFGATVIKNTRPVWQLSDAKGKVLFNGVLSQRDIPLGNCFQLGKISQDLKTIKRASKLTLTVTVNGYSNSWDLFVYPAEKPALAEDILVTQVLDKKAVSILENGGRVLLTLKKGGVKNGCGGDVAVGFSSIFWNTAWTKGQPPHTLGILCNPGHPALNEFPTDYYSNWQWWDAMSHSSVIIADSIAKNMRPVIRVIDDWVTARSLGLLYECKVGKGKLMLCGIDLVTDADNRIAAQQLLYSIKKYMAGQLFNPTVPVTAEKIGALLN